MSPDGLGPGDQYRDGITGVIVTVLGEREPCGDRFGRAASRYWARRGDTGAEGWIMFGPGALPLERVEEA